MIIRTRTSSNNINRQLRKEIAMAYRLIHRSLFKKGLSEPLQEHNPAAWRKACKITDDILFIMLCIGILAFFCFAFIGCVRADEIPEYKAVKAIIGEAEGEPYLGKLAVACAIRNRGTLHGVYGLDAPRVKNHLYSQDTLVAATLAWNESQEDKTCDDLIHGASYWEGDDFPTPRWALGMTVTAHIGHQTFFRDEK